jgi:alpha-L-fucosidase
VSRKARTSINSTSRNTATRPNSAFKAVINEWKAEEWNPNELLALYKKAGAKYLVALANYHDNFDLYNSTHQPWQTYTYLSQWYYDRRIYDHHGYKSAQTVIHTLIDVVSKKGNLPLSVPVRGNGSIDDQERAIVEGIAAWMQVNGESIYGTRPWEIFGEGPALTATAALSAQGFNEGKGKPFGTEDIHYITKGKVLFATALAWPSSGRLLLKSLAAGGPHYAGKVKQVELLGAPGKLKFEHTPDGLTVGLPAQKPNASAYVLKIVSA